MLIDYVSQTMEYGDFQQLFADSKHMPGQQAQKFHRLMMQGLAANGAKVHAVSERPITSANCSDLYLPKSGRTERGISWDYGSVLNLPKIKNIWQMNEAYRAVANDAKKNNAAIVDVLNASIAYGASVAAKRNGRPCIGIVTDIPVLMVGGKTNPSYINLVNKAIDNCTGFILLTNDMNEVMNKSGKPFVVIEALCDVNMKSAERKPDTGVKKCLYAGMLDERYGLKTMVEGFIEADISGAELHLYGDGSYVDKLKKVCAEHRNIIYHGTAMNNEIVSEELSATLLINPRPTNEEFTKYSFPSKNMEYMVSGTPVLTTRLPGMPNEYYPYVFLIDDETTKGMAEAFRRVLLLPKEALDEKGAAAKRFVLAEKNNIVQAKKIIELIESMLADSKS